MADAERFEGPSRDDRGRLFTPRVGMTLFEIVRHRLWQINDEQGQTLLNVSGSPVASEANDFNTAIMDSEGRLIAVGPYIMVHVSALSLFVENAISRLGRDNIVDGDVYVVNDPWCGAVHQNDVGIIKPVFGDGELVAWVGSVVHTVDIGGPVPGSWNPSAHTAFEEAPRYRFLRIVQGDVEQAAVLDTLRCNSRLGDALELDLRSQIAAANVCARRLDELFERYSIETVLAVFKDVQDYSEALLRAKLEDMPDGTWSARDYIDHDGHHDLIKAVRLSLTKRGSHLEFDFAGTDPAADGFVNCTYAALLGGVVSAVLAYLCGDIPWNGGVTRALSVHAEEGTVINAAFPSAVGAAPVNAGWSTLNVASITLAKMLTAAPASDAAMAVWVGSSFLYNVFGEDRLGDQFGTMMLASTLGGGGARSFADGYDNSGPLSSPKPSVINVETAEDRFPFLYLYRRKAPDSGGAGMFRGGLSAESAVAVYGTKRLKAIVSTLGTGHSSSAGIRGGYPGGGSNGILIRDAHPEDLINEGLTRAIGFSDADGPQEFLPSKCTLDLNEGDVLITVAHGGGGYGDPLRRDVGAVSTDVATGLVSVDEAQRLYGVAFTDAGLVDEAATAARRDEVRSRRRQGRPLAVEAAGASGLSPEVLDALRTCSTCGTGGHAERLSVTVSSHSLDTAGPWIARRYGGDSPYFQLDEYTCARCDDLLWTQVVLKEQASGSDSHPPTD